MLSQSENLKGRNKEDKKMKKENLKQWFSLLYSFVSMCEGDCCNVSNCTTTSYIS